MFVRWFCCVRSRSRFLGALVVWFVISMTIFFVFLETNKTTTFLDAIKMTRTPFSARPQGQLFTVVIPAFGPNNQYRGLKEGMVMSKVLKRTIVRSHFTKHNTLGGGGLRPFEDTFDGETLSGYVPSISMDDFKNQTGGLIDILIWVRKADSYWQKQLENYLEITNMRVQTHVYCNYQDWNVHPEDPNSKVYFTQEEHFAAYLRSVNITDHSRVRTIGIAFPFRNLEGALNEHVGETARHFERTRKTKETAEQAWNEMGTTKEKLLTVHWRHGEQTCRVEKEIYHEGFDFCFGTSAYFWTKLDDFIELLEGLLKQQDLTHIYLATDSVDTVIYERMKSKLPIRRASDIPTLMKIDDNYMLSLVEQEICTQSRYFVASAQTTWSEFITNHWDSQKKFNPNVKAPFIEQLDGLFIRTGKKMIQHDFWGWILKHPKTPPARCIKKDHDYIGGDIKASRVGGLFECYNECLKTLNCTCWTFSNIQGICYLKGPNCVIKNVSVTLELTSSPMECPIERTGPNNCWLKDADYPGNDVGSESTSSEESCNNRCTETAGCKCWTFVKSNGVCWMKGKCENPVETDPGMVSGPIDCPK
eukprot:TRINITY_DN4169_c1_g2_i1.p1 TRINITY_DN4169_c1_g2~~TRINITY_DN4169_c1_g2_i1.p1  ORF type:complete len:589 (-),score=100.58 TRINITY_DN4169_c1_g2_i1:75-1841(-)